MDWGGANSRFLGLVSVWAARSFDQTALRPSVIKRIRQIDVKYITHITSFGVTAWTCMCELPRCTVHWTRISIHWILNNYYYPFHSKLLKQSSVSRVNWRRSYSSWTYSRGCFVWVYVSSQSFCVLHQLCIKLDYMLINHCFPVVCFSLYNHYFICLLSLCKLYFFFFLYIIHIFVYIIIFMILNTCNFIKRIEQVLAELDIRYRRLCYYY